MNRLVPSSTLAARGLTFVELLIVIVVVAILVVVALPTLNEAQARAKVSRSKSDLQTIAGAIELYTVDYQTPPSQNELGLAPPQLSTPISYLSSGFMEDPFTGNLRADLRQSEQWTKYRYNNFSPNSETPSPYMFDRHGSYFVYGVGPGLGGFLVPLPDGRTDLGVYDPTNGIISPGRVIRSQKANTSTGSFYQRTNQT